jgi:hypothetical protein
MVPAWMIRAPFVASACQVSRHLICYSLFHTHNFSAFTTKVVNNAPLSFSMFACMHVKVGETPDFCGILCCLVSKDLSALTVLVAMAQQQQ